MIKISVHIVINYSTRYMHFAIFAHGPAIAYIFSSYCIQERLGRGAGRKNYLFRGSKGGLNKGVSARARRKGGRVRYTEGGICFFGLRVFSGLSLGGKEGDLDFFKIFSFFEKFKIFFLVFHRNSSQHFFFSFWGYEEM